MARFLIIEAYDFQGYPTGGSATFSDHLVKSFGSDIAIVGITTIDTKIVGKWSKKTISSIEYDYFPVKYVKKHIDRKSLIPPRLKWYLALRKYKFKIKNYGCSNVFIQSPDTLLAVYSWKFNNICYRFAGLTNPLTMSRYKWARGLDRMFEKIFTPKLKYVNTLLATASKQEIDIFAQKVVSFAVDNHIVQFPTRVDTSVFFPMNKKNDLRMKLGFDFSSKIIITSGRLSEVKGWKLLLDSFKQFIKDYPESCFLFVGNGQDKAKIEAYANDLGISDKIRLLGFLPKEQLSLYLNLADLYIMGSFFEGWPTSMVEALACGIPICSTNFGTAEEIINNEKLGIVVKTRNSIDFAESMKKALFIQYDEKYYSHEIEKYAARNLKNELCKHWKI